MRILLVEDDELLGDGVRAGLIQQGYTVDWVKDGQDAVQALSPPETFDIIVLDLGLPRRSGLEILKIIRAKGIKTPAIIITSRETVEDTIKGLDAGADDYVTKPFDLSALCARIRSLQRRSTSRAEPLLSWGGVVLDLAARTVTKDNELVNLSRRGLPCYKNFLRILDTYYHATNLCNRCMVGGKRWIATRLKYIFIIYARNLAQTLSALSGV